MKKCLTNSKSDVENLCKMKIDIPFESEEKAKIALEVLKVDSVDPESDHHAKEHIYVEKNILYAQYITDTPKALRSCASSFYDKLMLITDLIKEFSPSQPLTN